MELSAGVEKDILTLPQVEEFDLLRARADPSIFDNAQLFVEIGQHCERAEVAHGQLSALVHQLRSKKIRLRDVSSLNLAKWYFKQSYKGTDDTLERYIANLQKWLCVPSCFMPQRITISAPVPKWITPGSEVAALDKANEWWHAVALEVTNKKVKVFWVGFPPKIFAPRSRLKVGENPEFVDKAMLRAYEADADAFDIKTGSETCYDVAWIHAKYLPTPTTFSEVIVVSSSEADTEDDQTPAEIDAEMHAKATAEAEVEAKAEAEAKANDINAKKQREAKKALAATTSRDKQAADRATRQAALAAIREQKVVERDTQDLASSCDDHGNLESDSQDSIDAGSPSASEGDSASSANSSLDDRHDDEEEEEDVVAEEEKEVEEEEEDDEGENAVAAESVNEADVGKLAAAVDVDPPSCRRRQHFDLTALKSSARTDLAKSTAVVEHFYWSHGHWTMEECISTLECLARNPSDHSEFVEEFKVAMSHLNSRCIALARLYSNSEFNVLYKEAAKALDDYEGMEPIQTRAFVEQNLLLYGFIITPRMWSKLEILLIMCILLDSSLVYQSINQKTGSERTEVFQNR